MTQSTLSTLEDTKSNEIKEKVNLIYNDTNYSIKVQTSLDRELETCNEFKFSIAFITESGLACIKQILDNRRTTVKGKIITTDYLNFSEPGALRDLINFDNIETRMFTKEDFHTKGYLFYKNDEKSLIIGSSNLTQKALNTNKEWNVFLSSNDDKNNLITQTENEFEKMWGASTPLTKEWIADYEPRHIKSKIERDKEIFNNKRYPEIITPNEMQKEALQNISQMRNKGADKALLISATGTGKTYLSAFDIKESKPTKVLFLVHREQILDAAIESYKDILGHNIKTRKIPGKGDCNDADFVFSTIQSMSKKHILEQFRKDYFDYIICDEAHHSVATGYDSIISYFKPKFMLGMTATPERMDDCDVFAQFNHNIAYEIRLQDALKKEMLCPFHYYGITEIEVDGHVLSDDDENITCLTSDERVKHIIEKAEFYGYSGDRVKGLIFCSKIEEGKELSLKLNEKGYHTQFICGKDSADIREKAVDRLEQKEKENSLDYIITVDVFNEGVDIKSVNQIIMLRPTQSSTIFIQQLGRGLRKIAHNNREKEYLVVIDFIGNYKNNFLIPIALSGDSSMNKENLRRYIMTGNSEIPGCSTVNFDNISKERIFKSINQSKLSSLLKNDYLTLTKMLGYCPNLSYLSQSSKIDPTVIIEKYGSLNSFLRKIKLTSVEYSKEEELAIKFISKKFTNGKRPEELEILKNIIDYDEITIDHVTQTIADKYGLVDIDESVSSSISILSGNFSKELDGETLIAVSDNTIRKSQYFDACLKNINLKKDVVDVITCGINIFNDKYKKYYDGNFTLYQRYSRTDVCRMLNLDNVGLAGVMFGYKFFDNKCPIFVTYNKDNSFTKSTQYEDRFIDRDRFSWMTKNGCTIDCKEVKLLLDENSKLYFFIQKGYDDSSDFYYLGTVRPDLNNVVETKMLNDKGNAVPVVNIQLKFNKQVPDALYNYIIKQIPSSFTVENSISPGP